MAFPRVKDPSYTLTLRRKAVENINSKFLDLKQYIKELIEIVFKDEETAVLGEGVNGKYLFFLNALQKRINDNLLLNMDRYTEDLTQHWLIQYIVTGYWRGVKSARDDINTKLKSEGIFLAPLSLLGIEGRGVKEQEANEFLKEVFEKKEFEETGRIPIQVEEEISKDIRLPVGEFKDGVLTKVEEEELSIPRELVDANPEIAPYSPPLPVPVDKEGLSTIYRPRQIPIKEVLSTPLHKTNSKLFYSKIISQFKNATSVMQTDISNVLVEGITTGQKIQDIANNIAQSVDKVGLSRARLIAQTEIVKVYNVGKAVETNYINNFLQSIDTGLQVQLAWITKADSRVRERHKRWHNRLMTPEQVIMRSGEAGCRCSVKAFVIDKEI